MLEVKGSKNAWTTLKSVCVEKSWENKLEAFSNRLYEYLCLK